MSKTIELSTFVRGKVHRIVSQMKALENELNETLVIFASSSSDFDENTKINLEPDLSSIKLEKIDKDKVDTKEASRQV